MVLPYENPKWERLRKDISQVGYHFEDIPSMDGYVKRLRQSAMRKEDYAHYFASLSLRYHSWVRDRYLMNPNDPMLADDIYRSGVAGVISQQLGGLDLPQWENEFATALYKQAGHWSHMLYQKYPVSPIANPEDKKLKQPRLIADTNAFSRAFPETEAEILSQYFRSDFKVADAQRRWEQYMIRRHAQKQWQPPEPSPVHRVRKEDRYTSDDYRQVFDLLRYLSFPLEAEIEDIF